MLSYIIFSILFESVEPSYSALAALIPPPSLVPAIMAETTASGIPNRAPNDLNLAHQKIPVKKGNSIGPVLEAKSVFAVDLTSATPIFEKQIFERRKIASIEKLIAAMVILDNHKTDEKVTVSANAASQGGSKIWLKTGEELTVGNLLTGMLVSSGNDAAIALAEFDAGSEKAFVAKMNKKSAELGLKDTHFSNAKGFDGEFNYSTAFDTLLFSRASLNYPEIRERVLIKSGEITSVTGGIKHKLENTNELLENPHFKVVGLKTGTTPEAGESFVALAKAPNDHEILTVILNSPDRFKETKILLDWAFRNFEFP